MSTCFFVVETNGHQPEFEGMNEGVMTNQLELVIGETTIAIMFDSADDLITFCTQHNIDCANDQGARHA